MGNDPTRHIARRAMVVGALTLLGGLWACTPSVDESMLIPLRSDPLATEGFGLKLAGETATGYTSAMGKPNYARLERVFSLNPADKQQVLANAVALAEAAGWSADAPPNEALLSWQGSKSSPRRSCSLSITEAGDQLIVQLTNLETP